MVGRKVSVSSSDTVPCGARGHRGWQEPAPRQLFLQVVDRAETRLLLNEGWDVGPGWTSGARKGAEGEKGKAGLGDGPQERGWCVHIEAHTGVGLAASGPPVTRGGAGSSYAALVPSSDLSSGVTLDK